MSIVQTHSVFCDGYDGDAPCCQWAGQTTDGVREARRWAKEMGWTRLAGEDFCPRHAPPPAREGGS